MSVFYQKKVILISLAVLILLGIVGFFIKSSIFSWRKVQILGSEVSSKHWFLLERKSNLELFFQGVPGDASSSTLLKTFKVKTGIPSQRPTPLPQLLGKEYWVITEKLDSQGDPETSPYFLTLNIPAPSDPPYGPSVYDECNGQCNWEIPGPFGLHGVAGNLAKLENDDPGSSGCIRHSDEDITYIYNSLDPQKEEVRYYIKDI